MRGNNKVFYNQQSKPYVDQYANNDNKINLKDMNLMFEQTVSNPTTSVGNNKAIGNSVIICAPKRLDEVQKMIDNLRNHQPIILELVGIADELACRILDFMSGAVYALNGTMQHYKNTFYLITPEGCSIKGL